MLESIKERIALGAQLYFAVVPEWVLDLPVSAQAVRVYCCLRRYADNKTGECYPSRRTLAMRARMSIATLDRCVKELVDNGALLVERRLGASGDYTSNLYTVLSVPHGVAADLSLPRPRIEATGSSKVDTRTTTNVNEKHLPSNYDEIEPTKPTADGLLTAATVFEEQADKNQSMAPLLRRIAKQLAQKAQEVEGD